MRRSHAIQETELGPPRGSKQDRISRAGAGFNLLLSTHRVRALLNRSPFSSSIVVHFYFIFMIIVINRSGNLPAPV